MNHVITPAPVRKTFTVRATPERAFEVFATRMGQWWLKSHSLGKSPLQDVRIEPWAGGRWYEQGEDGSECQWGHVIAWEPPGRLLLAWQLDAEWKFHPEQHTEIEVRFLPEGTGHTRVEFEHRNLERFGAKAAEVAKALESDGGWTGLLAAYAALLRE